MTCCFVALVALVLMGVGFGFILFFQQRRHRRQLKSTHSIPETLSTGVTLEKLQQRFQLAVGSNLLGRRLARLYAVLLDQDLIREYVKDLYLAPQIEARSIETNTALFRCAAEIEETLDDRTFQGNPANTLAAYLRNEFKKQKWNWPKHPYAWKQFFIQHHTKTLFGDE